MRKPSSRAAPPKKTVAEDSLADTETSRVIIVRVPVSTHKVLRIRVAELDTSIQKWVEALIERELGIRR